MATPYEYLGCGALGLIALLAVLRFLTKSRDVVHLSQESIEALGNVTRVAVQTGLDPLREDVQEVKTSLALVHQRLNMNDTQSTNRGISASPGNL